MKKIAILQSSYIPWKGYFDLVAAVDELIFYDEAQFTKSDWRNRNVLKTPQGTNWLSIPVGKSISRRICDVKLPDHRWQSKHWKTLGANYGRAASFKQASELLRPLYEEHQYETLSEVNRTFIRSISNYLGISTPITLSSTYSYEGDRVGKLVSLCKNSGASTYVSGPSAKNYLDVEQFQKSGIEVEWFEYNGYPTYPQLWGDFVHEVSIVDLIFSRGLSSYKYLKFAQT